jgi:glc operon protein GlcG
MRTKPSLTAQDAQTMMAACKAEAAARGWAVSIAIVDEGGYPLLVERLDGAGLLTADVAIRKARTAALMRNPTKGLQDRLLQNPAFLKIAEYLPLQGGMPIKVGGDCVGAIGVSGVQSHEDEAVASVGVAALDSSTL